MQADIPDELHFVLEGGKRALLSSAAFDLPLSVRCQVWLALGARELSNNEAQRTDGYFRRTMLEIYCCEKVLPIWDDVWADLPLPRELLWLALGHLIGELPRRKVVARLNELITALDSEDPQQSALLVGYAASAAVGTALQDVSLWGTAEFDLNVTEFSFDMDEWDAAFLAAIACSGALPGEPEVAVDRKREFWLWYLEHAVPMAWKSK